MRDKGPEAAAKLASGSLVSERALARISKRGAMISREQDVPVSASYRRALIDAGLEWRAESRWLNAVAGKVPQARLAALASLEFVDSLRPVIVFRRKPVVESTIPSLPRPGITPGSDSYDYGLSAAQIGAIEVDRLHEIGLDGHGVMMGLLDTGFDLDHPVFASLDVIATRNFLSGIPGDTNVGDEDPAEMGHGTATLSVCGGFLPGELIGAAPGASYALAKTEYTNQEIEIEEEHWIAGLEWADSIGCDLLSSSLGYTDWYEYADLDGNTAPATIAADMAAARGLLVVTAAGNEADDAWYYIIVPADGDSVLAVGASTIEGDRAAFSSFGPSADGRIKPDVMAPGVQVWSASPGGSFSFKSGSSFSTPLVAGLCALLLEDDPSLTPYDLILRLRSTATQADQPDNAMGYGIVRAGEAAGLNERFQTDRYEIWPNPTTDGFIQIVNPGMEYTQTTEYRILTSAGQPVYAGRFYGPAGFWRGVNEQGEDVASGVYLLWLKSDRGEELLKVALLRGRS
ncbi:MAG: S8 family serine peptidase [Candidatus Zixiibacteriota bacterium]